MIINSYVKDKLCFRVNYSHDTDIIENTAYISNFSSRYRRSLRTPRRAKSNFVKPTDYNKYYIDPKLRYKNALGNPKQDRNILKDEAHVYKNLHNWEYMNWAHPLEHKCMVNPYIRTKIIKEDKFENLVDFKKYTEKKGSRLPLIVQDVLQGKM